MALAWGASSAEELNRELIAAAKAGDLAGVKEALGRGADVRACDDSALRWATAAGDLPLVGFLAGRIFEPSFYREGTRQDIEAELRTLAGKVRSFCGAVRARAAIGIVEQEALRAADILDREARFGNADKDAGAAGSEVAAKIARERGIGRREGVRDEPGGARRDRFETNERPRAGAMGSVKSVTGRGEAGDGADVSSGLGREAEARSCRSRGGRRGPKRDGMDGHAQINLRTRRDSVERFYAISFRQGWVLSETFERAVSALEREVADGGQKEGGAAEAPR